MNELEAAEERPPWVRQRDADEPWEVTGLETAEWAMDHVREAQATVTQLGQQYATWKAQLDAWLEDAERPARRALLFFSDRLERYALEQRELTGAKTIKVPSGKVSTREQLATVEVENEELLVAAAAELRVPSHTGELVPLLEQITVRKVQLALLREHVSISPQATGATLWTWTCGHTLESYAPDAPDVCPTCGDESPPESQVVMALVPVTIVGDRVPGVAVRARKVTAKAQPIEHSSGPETAQVLES